jgi:hypothetical protein
MDHSGCKATKIPYLPFESDVLSYLINWQLMDLNPQEMERKNVTARRAVEQQLLGKEEELEALVNVIALSKSSPEILARRIDETQAAIDKLRTELKNMSSARLSEQDLRDNAALFLQLMEGSDQDFRKKVQVALRRQIKKVEVAGNVFSLTYVDGTIATSDFHWIGWQADINLGQPDLE